MATISSARKWGTFALCAVVALVPNVDLTALNQAIPRISADLGPSATQILWISDAYGFALAALLVTMGGIGDRIGHRRLLLIGTALFAAASAVTAYAGSAELLIGARALLGVAGATLMPSALSLIRAVFTDPKQRTAAVGGFMAVGGLAVGLGPVVAGALLGHFWWGSVFLINVPVMLFVLVAGLAVLPKAPATVSGRLDLASVPLSAAGVLGLVYAVKEAAAHGGEPRVYVAAVVGVAGIAAFLWRQTRLDEPLIDVSLFRDRAFTGSVSANLFAMFALVAQSLIFSLYFQLVLGWSPLRAGLAGLPGALGAMAGGAALAPPLIAAAGRARTVALGMVIAAAAFASFQVVGTGTAYWIIAIPTVLSGVGMGLALTVTGDTVLASVPRRRTGAASAISETATELGGALGLAVLGSVLNLVYRNALDLPAGVPHGPAAHARDSLPGAFEAASALPAQAGAQVVDAARTAFVDGMHAALLLSAGFAVLVAGAALVTLRSVPKVIPDAAEEPVPVA
ncbi:Antiseptic resistance protein [Actinomadura rubteroloni]|uniref:Antiseptic resistance protein n=1 Tax=Actinomadura rubteroloni TaxID=1926885 RepID=A0A2P4UEF2_9ACTN|nr:MFS transporter [Actinomadura rubteroloni]POM23392.1 Antiseptic resistance protein [Actinomadura rubteroloni]